MDQIELPTSSEVVPAAPPTLPDIGSAHYQADGSVRIHYVNDTETVCAADDTTSMVGKHLNEWVLAGGVIGPYVGHLPTPYDVDKERDRRMALGQELFLKSGKVFSLATATPEDLRNINYASDTALTLVAKLIPELVASDLPGTLVPLPVDAGDPLQQPQDPMMRFRDYFRIERQCTYHEMAEISVRITDNINQLNRAAHLLKDMHPNIPADYTDDSYWPNIPLPPPTPPPA